MKSRPQGPPRQSASSQLSASAQMSTSSKLSASSQNVLQVTSAWKRAQLYYASGYCCEQAIYAAFAREMGLSLVGAQQAAPKRKDRGTGCGAAMAAIRVLERIDPKAEGVAQSVLQFRSAFLATFGTNDCASISEQRKGLSDCMDVIGRTAQLLEQIILETRGRDL